MTTKQHPLRPLTRRPVLAGLASLAALSGVRLAHAADSGPEQLARGIAEITKGATVLPGRVKLELPELAENGNSVSMTIVVESPQSAADHVRTIHVISEKNPIADVVKFHIGPRAGRARVQSSIRLADTQRVVALAEMSDGRFWSGEASVIVALAACIDAG